MRKKIAIIGASGYTGSELVRILSRHPNVEISLITSESRAGERFSDVHPAFERIADQVLEPAARIADHQPDLVFLALPHGISMKHARPLVERGIPVIDLSGDFRLSKPAVYEAWYKKEHTWQEGFKHSVYGLPELFRSKIPGAKLIANPGCYPTSVILGIAPLIQARLADPAYIIADCKSGITGAGIKSKPANHFPTAHDNFRAYGLKHHRHTIEIHEIAQGLSEREPVIQFTPHLLPVDRGIISTIYMKPAVRGLNDARIQDAYREFYEDHPFVRLRDRPPELKHVRGSNYCDIHATYDQRTNNVIVISAIDNLVKGAAGQAVQNMNLIFQWEETLGLDQVPVTP